MKKFNTFPSKINHATGQLGSSPHNSSNLSTFRLSKFIKNYRYTPAAWKRHAYREIMK